MPSDTISSTPQEPSGKGKKNKKKKGGAKQKGNETQGGPAQSSVQEDSAPQPQPAAPPDDDTNKERPNGSQHVDVEDSKDAADKQPTPPDSRDVDELNTKTDNMTINDSQNSEHVGSTSNSDADPRFDALVRDRDSLRAEVAEMRKSLEQIQSKHDEDMTSMQKKLEDTQNEKEQAETQFQNLLGKVNTIKTQLGERLKADAEELSHARAHIEDLESRNTNLQSEVESKSSQISSLEEDAAQKSKELSSLRNRTNLSQQNWSKEKEELLDQENYIRSEFEEAKQAMHNWEILAMEERSIRENLSEKVTDLEEQLASLKGDYEKAASECNTQSVTVDGLQRALEEIQAARKKELREVVENSDAQVEELKRKLQAAEKSANEARTTLEETEAELKRALPFEKEVKEKNLLIGKLRHEAVTLNDHLTKALRFLKRGRPEDNVDRHIVTNHFLHFLTLDRSDPKKFQILQLIAALLGWTDEQREQAGLARPGTSTALKVGGSPVHRTPSSPALSTDYFADNGSTRKESLAELWSNFLEQEAQTGGAGKDSRRGSQSETAKTSP